MADILEDDFNAVDGFNLIKIKKRGWEILDNDHNFTRSKYNRQWDYDIIITTGSGDYKFKGERTIEERNVYQ